MATEASLAAVGGAAASLLPSPWGAAAAGAVRTLAAYLGRFASEDKPFSKALPPSSRGGSHRLKMMIDPARAGARMLQINNIRWAADTNDYSVLEGTFGHTRSLVLPVRAYEDKAVIGIPEETFGLD